MVFVSIVDNGCILLEDFFRFMIKILSHLMNLKLRFAPGTAHPNPATHPGDFQFS